jgi:dihydroorotate dehydrogenase electron transfer subunit
MDPSGVYGQMMDNSAMTQACSEVRVAGLNHLGQGLFFELILEHPGWAGWKPGQFVMLRPEEWGGSPLLPRPFSIAGVDRDGLRILFQVVGQGTRLMARLGRGEKVVLWGPLGNGFAVPEGRNLLLLAGGMGIAPFLGLGLTHPFPERLELVFGHRVPLECYPFGRLQALMKAEAHRQETAADIARFVEYLERKALEHSGGMILACGPEPFLKAVQSISASTGVSAQLSLERRMACGIGACLGCVVEMPGLGPVQSCTKGPVFYANEIVL